MYVYFKGKPTLPVKDGYDIFMGTLHKGKTSRSTEIQRCEMYREKNSTWEDSQRCDSAIGDELLERQLLVTKRKKNETDEELRRRISFNTSISLNRWKYIEGGFWEHEWGRL